MSMEEHLCLHHGTTIGCMAVWCNPSLVTCPLLSGGLGESPPACAISIQTSNMLPTTSVVPVQEPADNDIKESSCASGSQAFLTVTTQFEQTQQSVAKLQSEC